jgi:hypothetical protein
MGGAGGMDFMQIIEIFMQMMTQGESMMEMMKPLMQGMMMAGGGGMPFKRSEGGQEVAPENVDAIIGFLANAFALESGVSADEIARRIQEQMAKKS